MCKRNGWNKVLISAAACALMTGCATADRLSKVGEAPAMSSISNPVTQDGYQPVSLPMPAPQKVLREKNSLWQSDRVTFFKDQRASNIGDVITVLIDIKDEAELDNTTQRTRTSTEGAGLDALLGYEQSLNRVLPQAVNSGNLAQFDSSSNHRGSGSIEREDEITMRMAALITQVLPNGNMVIHGKQEVLVNYEKRILAIDGVIRPEDIGVQNTVSYDQIAEARIIYGGEGQISDMQQPRYGQQIYDVIFPF
jgi:flagellar L-ring protein precursor FlgH